MPATTINTTTTTTLAINLHKSTKPAHLGFVECSLPYLRASAAATAAAAVGTGRVAYQFSFGRIEWRRCAARIKNQF